jgi:hypothetical protein
MPIYHYQVVTDDDSGEVFEVLQPMSDPPLTAHPETGVPVKRVFTTANAPRAWTGNNMKANLSDKNLDRMGFTKYVKSDNGKYEKVVGKGPSKINKPPAG